jgi:hypothetical protein
MPQQVGELIWIVSHGLPWATGWLVAFLALVATAVVIVRALGWLAGSVAYALRQLENCRLAWEELGFARGGTLIMFAVFAVVLALLVLALTQ